MNSQSKVERRVPWSRSRRGLVTTLVALQAVAVIAVAPQLSSPASAAAVDLTGAWAGNAAAGPWTASTPIGLGVSAVATSPAGGSFAFTGTQTLQSPFNGLPDPFPYSADYVPDHESFAAVASWPDTTSTGTLTFTFSEPVLNPILHVDRFGGTQADSTANSSIFTLVTPGTMTKLAGVDHLVVDAAGTSFQRTVGTLLDATATASCSANGTLGTACGSIQINGTFTEIEFEWRGAGSNIAAADGIELTWELVGIPEVAFSKTSDADAPLLDGQVVNYEIVVENTASAPIPDLEVTDLLPSGLVYVPNSTTATYDTSTSSDTSLFLDTFEAGLTPWNQDDNDDTNDDVNVLSNDGSNRLHIQDDNAGAWRAVGDLTSFDSAILTFDFRRFGLEPGDFIEIYAATDVSGVSTTNANCSTSSSWTQIGNIPRLQQTDPGYQTGTFVLPAAFLTANPGVCFFTPPILTDGDDFLFDNIQVIGTTITNSTVVLDNDPGTAIPALADGTPDPGVLVGPADSVNLTSANTLTITFQAVVDFSTLPQDAEDLTNESVVDAPNLPSSETATVTDPLSVADLSVVKSDSGTVLPGGQITYTIEVENLGPTAAVNTVVTDTPDANVTIDSVSSSQGGCTVFPCDLGDIPFGDTATITVLATVDAGAPATGTVGTDGNEPGVGDCVGADLCNIASASSDSLDWDTTNNTDDEPTNVVAPEIEIVKSAGTPTDNGDGTFDVDYTVTVSNTGQAPGTYDVTDTLTTATGITSAVTAGPTYDAGASTDASAETPGALPALVTGGTIDNGSTDVFVYTVRFTVAPTAPVPDPCSDATGSHGADNDAATSTGATDEACVDLDVPRLELDKSLSGYDDVDGDGQVSEGDELQFDFLIENTGNTSISAIDLQDANPGVTVTCPATTTGGAAYGDTLAAGDSITCTGTYDVLQTDVDDAEVVNTASVTGTPSGGQLPPVPPSAVTTPINQNPSILLTKENTSGTGPFNDGDPIVYRFTVENTGDVSLSNVTLSDTLLTGATFTCATDLAVGASTTCDVTYNVTQQNLDDGQVANTASVTADSPLGVEVDDTDDELIVLQQSPSVDIVKSHDAAPTIDADSSGVISEGDTITYRFVVTNNGNVSLDTLVVDDPLTGPATCDDTVLAPGASTDCSVAYVVSPANGAAGVINNTATVTAESPSGAEATDSDSDVVTVAPPPSISVSKGLVGINGTGGGFLDTWEAGDTLNYEFVVTNTGGAPLDPVSISDTVIAPADISCAATSLAPGASTTCTGDYPVQQGDFDLGTISNTVTASGEAPNGDVVTDEASHVADTTQRVAGISIIKSVSGTPEAGATLTYSFLVTNTGNVRLNSVGVTDTFLPTVPTCLETSLEPGASTTCSAPYAVQPTDVEAGVIDNIATANGSPIGGLGDVDDTDSLSTPVAQNPSIDLDKSEAITTDIAPVGLSLGDVLTYTIVIANDGDVTLNGVTLTDDLLGYTDAPIDGAPCDGLDDSLAPGESVTCTDTYTVDQDDVDAGAVANQADTTGTSVAGVTVDATGSTSLVAAQSPGIQVDKALDGRNDLDASGNDSVDDVFDYVITVTNTGNVTLDPVTVTDARIGVDPGVGIDDPRCTSGGTGAALAPGESATCTFEYTLLQTDVDGGLIENTATGSGQPPAGLDPVNDTSTVTTTIQPVPALELVKSLDAQSADPIVEGTELTFRFDVTNTGNTTLTDITITDSIIASPISCVGALDPGETQSCTATYDVQQVDADAGEVVNTATASAQPPTPIGGAVPPRVVSDPSEVTTPIPQISLITILKEATTVPDPIVDGSQIEYTFTITNEGTVTVTDIEVDDSLLGIISCVASLAPGLSDTCTATYDVDQGDVDAGEVVNTATATGDVPPTAPPLPATPPSTVTTPIPSDPSWTFVKALFGNADEDGSGTVSLDDTLTFSFTVTNDGNVTISDIAIDDPKVGSVNCPTTTLAPGEVVSCTSDYAVTQGDVDDGQVFNSATVSGTTPPASDPPPVLPPSTVTTPIAVSPAITVVKSLQSTNDVDGDSLLATDDILTFAFLVTNTGDVTLDPVSVDDILVPSVSCPDTALAPGASTTCTGDYTISQLNVDATSVTNTATAMGQPPTPVGGPVPDPVLSPESTVVTPLSTVADIAVTKTFTANADGDGSSSVTLDDVLTFTITIENTGTVTLDPLTYDDALIGVVDGTCGASSLAAGAITTCDVLYTVQQTDVNAGSVTNVVVVDGTPPAATGLTDATDTDDVVVPVTQITALTLDKSHTVVDADLDGLTEPGDVVTYTFVATNTGTTVLSDVSITDPLVGLSALSCTPAQPADLDPGDTLSCTATYDITQVDVDAGRVDNMATADGTPPVGAPPLDPPTATDVVPIDRVPSIDLTKAITAGPADPGVDDTITYTFTIENTGNVTLDPVELTDTKLGLTNITCGAGVLLASATTSCTADYDVTQDDVDAGVISNSASVTGEPPPGLPTVDDTDTLDQILAQNPSITLEKSVVNNDDIADGELSENDTLTYTFNIENDGDVTLSVVTLTDALPNLGPITCVPALPADFDPNDTASCTADYTVTALDVAAGQVVNDAMVTGNPPIGDPVQSSDQKIVTVTESPSIGLTKSAILPDPDPSVDDIITYEFVVANTGNVTLDSILVTDTTLPGLSAIDCGGVTTLAIGADVTCTATYTIIQTDIDNGLIENTASVSGDSPAGETVSDADDERIVPNQEPDVTIDKAFASNADEDGSGSITADDTLTYDITITNSGNVTLTSVTFSDVRLGLTDVTCGGVTTLLPDEVTTCQVTYVVLQDDVDAGPIENTATATATPPVGPDVTADDIETVVPAQLGVLDLDKRVASNADEDGSLSISVDDTLTYEFDVTNVGSVTLFDIVVTDLLVGSVLCPPTTAGLEPGDAITCSATYVVDQDDVNAGVIDNSAEANATPPPNVPAPPPATDQVSTPIDRLPELVIDKTSDAGVLSVNDIVTYTFSLENTGNVTLDPVVVADPLPGLSGIDCGGVTALEPDDTLDCTATYTVDQDDIDNGSIDNIVTVTATPPPGLADLVETDDLTIVIPAVPRIVLEKTADPAADPAVNSVVEFTFVVTNPGNVTLDPVGVADGLAGVTAPACDATVLAPGGTITCTAFYTVDQDDVDAGGFTNSATAIGVAPDGVTVVNDVDAVTVPIGSNPAIELDKVLAGNADEDGSNSVSLDDTLTYQFDITNVGDVTLDPVDYTDALLGLTDAACGDTRLLPDASTTCTATYVVEQTDVDAGQITNNALASGAPPSGDDVTDPATVVTPVEQLAATELVKTATHDDADLDSLVDVGEDIDYSIVLTNTGTVTLTDAAITDSLISVLTCDLVAPVTLAPGESLTCTGSVTVDQDDVDAGQVVNEATGTATPPPSFTGVLPDATDDAIVPIDRVAGIDLLKSVVNNDADPVSLDDSLTYTFTIENTGNVNLDDVTLTDPFPFDAAPICDAGAITLPATLAPGQIVTCTADYTVIQDDIDAGLIENTATVDGQPPVGLDPVTDSETVTQVLPQNPSITLSKTATVTDGTFDSTADTIDYEFIIVNDGDVTLTVVDLTDILEISPQFSAIDCGASTLPATLVPTGTITCTAVYDVEQDDLDAGLVANEATATGNPPGGLPPVESTDTAVVTADGSPSINLTKSAIAPDPAVVETPDDDVTYEFVITNDGNLTLTAVTLDDPKIFTGGPVALSALSCVPAQVDDELAPGETATCTLIYDVVQDDIDAGEVRNSATASGQPPTPVGGPVPPPVTDTDDELIITPQTVAITVDKSFASNADEDGSTGITADDTLTYSFVITNAGNVTLQSVTVEDAKVGLDPAVAISTLACDVDVSDDQLAPGEVVTCTTTYVVPQSDVDAGVIENAVTVAGTPPIGLVVTDDDVETVSPAQASTFTLDKRLGTFDDLDFSSTISLDDVLNYEFEVVNTGTVTLTNIDVTDSLGIAVTCLDTELAPTESVVCTASYTVDQDDVDAGEVENTATATATPPVGAPPLDPIDDTVVTEVPQTPLLTLTKVRTDTTDPILDTSTLTYDLVATNDGNVTLTGVSITDSLDPALVCAPTQPATLAPGASLTCEASYEVDQGDVDAGQVENTANAIGTPPVGAPPLPPVPPVVVVTPIPPVPSLLLEKSAAAPAAVVAGDTITYTFDVTNNGNVSVTDVRIDDARLNLVNAACFFGPLAPLDTDSCTFDYPVTQPDIDAGEIVNIATTTGQPPTPTGAPTPPRVASPPSEVTTPLPPNPVISIDKTSDVTTTPVVDQVIEYSFLVVNEGNVTLDPVTVDDPLTNLSAIDCGGITALAPTAFVTCTATYTVTQIDINNGFIENTATAFGQPPNLPDGSTPPVVDDSDTETTVIAASPSLVTSKSLESFVSIGDGTYAVTFRLGVSNDGNVTIDDLELFDDIATQFASANVVAGSYAATDGTLTANAAWDGTATSNVLATGQSLEPTTSGDVLISFVIAPTVDETLQNVAASSGTPPVGPPLPPVVSPPVDLPIVTEPGIISGVVFTDVDGDGLYTPGVDTPIEGVEVVLTGTNAAGEPVDITVTTGPDGSYVFDDVLPGSYTVTETQPPGLLDGSESVDGVVVPTSAGGPDAIPVTLGTNQTTAIDFAEVEPSSLAGSVSDSNGNPISGVMVTLTGVDDLGNSVTVEVVTDADGEYVFDGLRPGTYTITETQPPNYLDGPDTVGTAGGTLTEPDSITDIVLGSGTTGTGYDFTEVGQTLGGTVFVDTNRNGADDAGETNLAGVTITLLDAAGNVIAETVTGPDGTYLFEGLPIGDYTVVQEQPDGYGSTTPNTVDVSLTFAMAGEVDFGESVSSIGGTVWSDTNGDGQQGAGEPGVPGVTVNLLDENGVVISTTTTDANGDYDFGGLLEGTYAIEVLPPSGQSLTRPGVGSDATDSDPDWVTGVTPPIVIAPTSCPSGDCPLTPPVDVDAGIVQPGADVSITGSVAPDTVAPGATVVFTFTPGNDSVVPLPDGVEVVVTLPAGFTPGVITAPGYEVTVVGNTVTLIYTGVLLPGETPPPFDIAATVSGSPGTFTVDATIRAIGFDDDPTPANNLETLTVTVVRPEIPRTGSEVARWLGTGSILAGIGLVLLLLTRRRRRRDGTLAAT